VLVIGVPLLPLSAMPGLGAAAPATNAAFLKECSACHWAIHPTLLPRKSWAAIMVSLDQHFGEDASLAPQSADEIASITGNASDKTTAMARTIPRVRCVKFMFVSLVPAMGTCP